MVTPNLEMDDRQQLRPSLLPLADDYSSQDLFKKEKINKLILMETEANIEVNIEISFLILMVWIEFVI